MFAFFAKRPYTDVRKHHSDKENSVMKTVIRKLPFLFFLLLFSCQSYNVKNITENIDSVLEKSPSGIDSIVELLNDSRILFIGAASHAFLNDKLFLNEENVTRLYEAGVRYVLCEGGIPDGPVYREADLAKKWIALFYPWETVGVQYGAKALGEIVNSINSRVSETERITFVGLESGRREFLQDEETEAYVLNYRDRYMADTAVKFIDGAPEDMKFLIVGGGLHGMTVQQDEMQFNPSEPSFSWKPLGAYLKERYHDDFKSVYFIPLDHAIDSSTYWSRLIDSTVWNAENFATKDVSYPDIARLDTQIPLFVPDAFDGYLVDKFGESGILYSYALNDPDILDEVLRQLKNDDEFFYRTQNEFDYADPETVFTLESYVRNIYFLKLFYGETFAYDFFNPETTLAAALQNLPREPLPLGLTKAEIKKYLTLMKYFYSVTEADSPQNASALFKENKRYLSSAQALFPAEPWIPYWYATMYYKMENYSESLKYYNDFFENPLSQSTQIYPEALNNAITCAKKTRNENLERYYTDMLRGLHNEHDIDVSEIQLFLY